jgi:hypothetical protein
MKTYELNGKTYLVHEDKLFVEANLLGGGTPRVEGGEMVNEAVAPVKRKYKARKSKVEKDHPWRKSDSKIIRHCKNCGEPGHQARTCTQGPGQSNKSPKETQGDFDPVPKAKEMDDDELREKIAEYREQGYDSLWIAAKLRIRLKKVNELWTPKEEEVELGAE